METAQEAEAGRTGGWRAILTQVSPQAQAPRPVSHLCWGERVDGKPSGTCSVRRVTRPQCHWTGLLVPLFLLHTGPQLGFGGAVPLERAALDRGCCDQDLGAGLYGARFGAVG